MKRILSLLISLVLVSGLSIPLPALALTSTATSSETITQAATADDSSGKTVDSSATTNSATSETTESTTTTNNTSDSSVSEADSVNSTTDKASRVASIAPASSVDETLEGSAYVEGEVVVVFNDDAESTTAENTLSKAATIADGQATEKKTVSNDTAVAQVTDGATVAQAVEELQGNPNVRIAQPNYIYTIFDDEQETADSSDTIETDDASVITTLTTQSTTINDPLIARQWSLDSVGLFNAWDYAKCNHTVSIAVIDTGIKADHADLANNIVGGYNSVSKIYGLSDINDTFGHGTHVAGIAAALTNNDIGVSGASYNANIVPIKASNNSGDFTTAALVGAYSYLLENAKADFDGDGTIETAAQEYNVRVINMSLGGPGTCTLDDALCESIDSANSVGILTVCAAGNQTNGLIVPYAEYPGDYDTCLSVINLTSENTRNSGSNYNESDVEEGTENRTKDISAPGTNIYSTTKDGAYGTMSGTSMASPLVAGIAALMFAENASLSPSDVKSILESTATDLGDTGWDQTYGYGKVDAAAAIKYASDSTFFNLTNFGSISAIPNEKYTGSAITPSPRVVCDGITLTQDKDYTLSYSNNTSVGTATVTATGIGAFTGSVETTFRIVSSGDPAADFVERLYVQCLGRASDAGGKANWVGHLRDGSTGADVAYGFLFSQEFREANYCNEHYVRKLYAALFDRDADAGGYDNWMGLLEDGWTREAVLNGFVNSDEFTALCARYGITRGSGVALPEYGTVPTGPCSICGLAAPVTQFVTRLYSTCLNRDPDPEGLAHWCGALWDHTNTGTATAYGFFFSQEFTGKGYGDAAYVTHLYNGIFGRDPDPQGYVNWIAHLSGGMSRVDVFYGFANSEEFTAMCNRYGISKG